MADPESKGVCANPLFDQIYPENCMNMKVFGQRGGLSFAPLLDPSMETPIQLENKTLCFVLNKPVAAGNNLLNRRQ